MKPTFKNPELEAMLTRMSGSDRRETIQFDRCRPQPVGCAGPAMEFKDALSLKEFTISGLCQECQDKVFG